MEFNIFGRKIVFKIERCKSCNHLTIVIEIHTKKWFKGKEFEFDTI